MFLAINAFCQEEQFDSVKSILQNTTNDTTRMRLLNYLTENLPEGEWQLYNDTLLSFAQEKLSGDIQNKALTKQYLQSLATAYNNKAIDLKYKGETGKALKFGLQAQDIFNTLNDTINIANSYYNNGRLYNSLGNIQSALSSLHTSLKFFEALYDIEKQTYALNIIGTIYKEQGEWSKAIENHNKAIALGQKINHKQSIGFSYACLGIAYMDKKEYTLALQYFKKEIELYTELGIIQDIASGHFYCGSVYKLQNKLNEATESYEQALILFKKINDTNGISKTTIGQGQTMLAKKNYISATHYFKQALALSQKLGYPKDMQLAADGLYKIYKMQGESNKALSMLELSKKMGDSIENTATNKAALKSQYKYEFEKKAQVDSIRSIEEKRVLDAQLSQAKTQRYLLVTAFSLFAMVAFFVYYRTRAIQRMRELKLRNKIASDLHDDVGSALSSISIFSEVANQKLNTKAEDAREVIAKIGSTSREILEDMGDIVWTISPKNDSIKTLAERMRSFAQNLLNEMNIQFQFDADESLQSYRLNMEQRKNVYLIFKEAINNAAKYSKATAIKAAIKLTGKNIELSVVDNGTGFDRQTVPKGNGLDNMEQRAAEIKARIDLETSPGTGTLLRLQFKAT
jgi:two-component system, NarL family, sensor histidine kinase UhpB